MTVNHTSNIRHAIAVALMTALLIVAPADASGDLRSNPMGPVTVELPPAGQHSGDANQGAPAGPLSRVSDALDISGSGPDTGPGASLNKEQPAESDPESTPAGTVISERELQPLAPAASGGAVDPGSAEANDAPGMAWGLRTALALIFVVSLIFLCKFAFTKLASRAGGSVAAQLGPAGRAPSGLLSVLARYPISKGVTLVLLRIDRRVLLLSQSGQGFSTLAEIDDPEEVASLIMRAEDEEGASLTRRFRSILSQAERDPGLIGEREYTIASPPALSRVDAAHQRLEPDGGDPPNDDSVMSLRERLRTLREVAV